MLADGIFQRVDIWITETRRGVVQGSILEIKHRGAFEFTIPAKRIGVGVGVGVRVGVAVGVTVGVRVGVGPLVGVESATASYDMGNRCEITARQQEQPRCDHEGCC